MIRIPVSVVESASLRTGDGLYVRSTISEGVGVDKVLQLIKYFRQFLFFNPLLFSYILYPVVMFFEGLNVRFCKVPCLIILGYFNDNIGVWSIVNDVGVW